MTICLEIALPVDHPLAERPNLALAELADEAFIMWPMVEGRGFHLQVIRLCSDAGFVPHVTQEAHGMHAVLSLVAVSAGVAVVPESMLSFRPDRIAYRPITEPGAAFALRFALHKPSPAALAFAEIALTGRPYYRRRSN